MALESELEDISEPKSMNEPEYNIRMLNWSSRFFDAIEWLSLLINIKEIQRKELVRHFEPALARYYDNIFQRWASEKQKLDCSYCPELKKLVNRVKRNSG